MDLGQRASHGQGQLRTGAETGVRGQRSVHGDPSAGVDAVMTQESPRELAAAFGILAVHAELAVARRRQQKRRRRHRGPDAAEPATARAPQIEHAEVQTRMCFDADLTLPGGEPGRDQERLLGMRGL
jgi:hypothetical protein